MKTTTGLLHALPLLGALLTVSSGFSASTREACGADCLCPAGWSGYLQSMSFGPSCSEAADDLYGTLYVTASDNCLQMTGGGVCREQFVVETCYYDPNWGSWWVRGHLRYRCEVCP